MTEKNARVRGARLPGTARRALGDDALRRAMEAVEANRQAARSRVEEALAGILFDGRTPVEIMIDDAKNRPPSLRRTAPDALRDAFDALDLEARVSAVAALVGTRDDVTGDVARINEAHDHVRRYGTLKMSE